MNRGWLPYLVCLTGFYVSTFLAFFINGGGGLLNKWLPSKMQWLHPFELPYPWRRITAEPGSWAAVFIPIALFAILLVQLPPLLQWILAFHWPAGFVSCPCLDKTPKGAKGEARDEAVALLDGHKSDTLESGGARKPLMSLRVVTRGDDAAFTWDVCKKNLAVLGQFRELSEGGGFGDNFEWIMEIVTERPLGLSGRMTGDEGVQVCEILVPPDYTTPNGTTHKARNLVYAALPGKSILGDEDFIVHLDEETEVTADALDSIAEFALKHPDRIGQGMNVFGRKETVENPLLTMCDTFRLLDDFCSFRLWHSLGSGLRGMKGSNFVIRSDVERFVSFDLGPDCSLLEDGAFAVVASQKGVKFGHYGGVMHEQSPLFIEDFYRQRRRWINGLMKVASTQSIEFRYRWMLLLSLVCWLLAPIFLPSFVAIVLIFRIPATWFTVLARVILTAPPAWGALWCASINFSAASRGKLMYILLILGTFIALPVTSALEFSAVIYSFCARTDHFQVVTKRLSQHVLVVGESLKE